MAVLDPAWWSSVLLLVVLIGLIRWHRPAPARARRLATDPTDAGGAGRRAAVSPALRVGRLARRWLPFLPADEARLGRAILVGLGAAMWGPFGLRNPFLSLPVGIAAAVVAWWSPELRRRRQSRRHAAAVLAGMPELIDLLAVAVGAGLTVPQAIDAVGARLRGPTGAALRAVSRRLALGAARTEALGVLVLELGEPARPLVAALRGADRYGLPLAATLQRIGDDARSRRRRQAEAHARRIPVRLLFPLVLCTLPAFALLTVVPLLAGSVSSVRPSTPSVDRSPPCCTSTSSSVPR